MGTLGQGKGETGRLMCGVRGGQGGCYSWTEKKVIFILGGMGQPLGEGFKEGLRGSVFTPEGPGDHEDGPGQLGRPGSRAKLKTLPSALKGWGRASGRTVRAEDSRLLAATANWRKLVCFEVLLFWSERRFRLSG